MKKIVQLPKNICICDYCGIEIEDQGSFMISIMCNGETIGEYGSFILAGDICSECASIFASIASKVLKDKGFIERYNYDETTLEKMKKILLL